MRLDAHAEHCESDSELANLCRSIRERDPESVLAVDLFSGAGGMSLGFEQAGIHVVLGADHDKEALETHRHHFAGMAIDWDLGDPDVVARVGRLVKENSIDVLAGGPPCQPFSKAGRSGMRYLVREGLREPHDRRRDLWRSYLEIVRLGEPRAVVMENVPDMALDREMFIIRSIVLELERMGYTVQQKVVDAWRYGVPQFRQRLILVAIRDGSGFEWPAEVSRKVTVSNAISDLPPVEGGWRPEGGAEGWIEYPGPRTAFQRDMRIGVSRADSDRVFDHITRPVRPDDLAAFELLDSESRYSDLPEHLKRYRDDIFDDKYKRLSGHDVSRTITAHIAKDGYWYIHPEQNRTLSIREAARLQTFPDWFRFAGPPSASFRQIGNAVPPRLGYAVGSAVLEALRAEGPRRPSSEQTGHALVTWFREDRRSSSPWLHSTSTWHVLLGETLLDRVSINIANSLWPLLEKFASPSDVLTRPDELDEILSWIGRDDRRERVRTLARCLGEVSEPDEEMLAGLVAENVLHQSLVDLALLASPEGEDPVIVTAGALRVASRFGRNTAGRRNLNSDGRLSIARLVGFGPDARLAQLALLELGTDVCLPASPSCGTCPLAAWCLSREDLA